MKNFSAVLLLSLFLTLSSSCRTQPTAAVQAAKETSTKTLRVAYDVFKQPRAYLLQIPGTLLNEGGKSVFQYANGKKGPVIQTKEDGTQGAYFQDKSGNILFKDFLTGTFTERMIFWMSAYRTSGELPAFKWKISKDIKQFGNYEVQRATTEFGGRVYTAWFTLQIPISDGPWKFHGLPGLILEVTDEEGAYGYTATEVSYPYVPTSDSPARSEVAPPEDGDMVDQETFAKAYESEFIKMQKRMMSQSGNRSGNMEVKMQAYHPQEKHDK